MTNKLEEKLTEEEFGTLVRTLPRKVRSEAITRAVKMGITTNPRNEKLALKILKKTDKVTAARILDRKGRFMEAAEIYRKEEHIPEYIEMLKKAGCSREANEIAEEEIKKSLTEYTRIDRFTDHQTIIRAERIAKAGGIDKVRELYKRAIDMSLEIIYKMSVDTDRKTRNNVFGGLYNLIGLAEKLEDETTLIQLKKCELMKDLIIANETRNIFTFIRVFELAESIGRKDQKDTARKKVFDILREKMAENRRYCSNHDSPGTPKRYNTPILEIPDAESMISICSTDKEKEFVLSVYERIENFPNAGQVALNLGHEKKARSNFRRAMQIEEKRGLYGLKNAAIFAKKCGELRKSKAYSQLNSMLTCEN